MSIIDQVDVSLDAAREVLERFWGYPDFRPGQDAAVRNVLSGGDALIVMPTGGGKSTAAARASATRCRRCSSPA
jgi:superfamily II DNA or RNA helicase